MAPAEPAAPAAVHANALTGTVRRASYLGDGVDYQVELDGSGAVLRVAGPTPARAGVGERVSLGIAAAACVPLADSG